MTDEKALMPIDQRTVMFYDDEIPTVLAVRGEGEQWEKRANTYYGRQG